MNWETVMGQVQNLIGQHADNQSGTGFNPAPLLAEVQQVFNQHTGTPGVQPDTGNLMNEIKSVIGQHADNQSATGFNPSQLLGDVEGVFAQRGQ